METKLPSLKVIWIKRLMDENSHAWKVIRLPDNGLTQIFHENFKPSKYHMHKLLYLPQFYRELTRFWENVRVTTLLRN